jgi:hypothetical protein
MSFPSRAEVEAVLTGLVEGSMTASQANDWACPLVTDDSRHPDAIDGAVWRSLNTLCGTDLLVAPAQPLHRQADFRAWLDQFHEDVRSSP